MTAAVLLKNADEPGSQAESPLALLSDRHREVVRSVDQIVQSGFAKRAAKYDEAAIFPEEDILDLWKHGMLLATLPVEDGGLGYGFDSGDPLCFFLTIERIAKVNPSSAHCFQVHNNAVQLLRAFGSKEQLGRFLEPTIKRGKVFVGAAAEPGGGRHSTVAKPVKGGVSVTGVKHYATNATFSEWMEVFVRNAETARVDTLMIHRDSPGLEIDAGVWNPTGMRACVSPLLRFNECFVPDDCILGGSGGFFSDLWLGKINFGFTANYLGAIQGMYGFAVDYLKNRGHKDVAHYQSYMGEMKARIDAARLLFYNAARLVPIDVKRALIASNEAKWLAVDTFHQVSSRIGQVVGSTGYFREFPLEQLSRDMAVHTIHRRHHVGAMLVGQSELGMPFDLNQS